MFPLMSKLNTCLPPLLDWLMLIRFNSQKKKVTVCKNKKSGGISIGRAAILFHSAYVGDSFFVSFKPRFPYANCKHLGIDIRCVE